MTPRLPRLRYVLFGVAVVLLPCELLLDPKNTFYADWHNHLQAMSYYSAFFRAHLAFPDVIHTQQIVGLVYPIFYAHWFYAVGGVFGSVLGADVAVRLIVIAVVSAQFYLTFRLFQTYSLNNGFALVMAIVVTWSIYPLTNLYNRGALTEFAAVCLLNMSICSFLMPEAFYSIGDYNVLRQVSAAQQGIPEVTLAFAPSSGGNFAEIAPVELQVDVDSVVKSNVYLFPWNKILVDSLDIPQQYYSAKEYLRTTQTFLASFALLSLWVVGMCAMPLLDR